MNTNEPAGSSSKGSNPEIGEKTEAIKKDALGLYENISQFLSELLDIRSDCDRDRTVEDVKNDIPFKGHNAWILVFSIFVASIGLNVSSTAVVIGAMLISPLMGPIVGVGLSVAINDIDTLKRSFVNLGVMVSLSVFTATVYFLLSPLAELTPELEARTAPTILDVLVAIFGGLALIVAKSKKGTMPNAIAGVAIATALMPPLCTVGYGISVWEPRFFLGALYLFSINAIFIALSTFVVAKLLRFPMIRYANSAKRRFTARIASILAIVAVIPAIWVFVNVLDESKTDRDYRDFLENDINANENLYLRKPIMDFDKKTLKLFFDGEISEATESDLRNEILKYEKLKDYELSIFGNKARGIDQVSKAYDRAIVELDRLQNTNDALNTQITELKKQLEELKSKLNDATASDNMDKFMAVTKDAKIQFPNLSTLGYGKVLNSDFKKMDTVKVIFPAWKYKVADSILKKQNRNLQLYLMKSLKADTLYVR